MPHFGSSPENIIPEDIVRSSTKSTDNQESKDQKTEIFSDFPELIKIRENIKNEFPNDFKQENFDIIGNMVLNHLQEKYSILDTHTYLANFGQIVFINCIKNNIKDFENNFADIFILAFEGLILKNKGDSKENANNNKEDKRDSEKDANNNKENANNNKEDKGDSEKDANNSKEDKRDSEKDANNSKENANNNKEDKRDSEKDANNSKENANNNKENANNNKENANNNKENANNNKEDKRDSEKDANKEKLALLNKHRKGLTESSDARTRQKYAIDRNSPEFANIIEKVNADENIKTMGLTPEETQDYAENIYIYQLIKKTEEKNRTEEEKVFIQEFDEINKDLNIDLSVFSPIEDNKPVNKPESTEKPKDGNGTSSFNQIAENVVTNPQIETFINGSTKETIPTSSPKEIIKNNIDSEFQDYIPYLGDDGFVDQNKIQSDISIDENTRNSLLQGVENVNQQIQKTLDKDKLNNPLIKERIIVNCFKYLSKYLGNNGFADKIKVDINQDIKFTENPMTININGDIKGDHIGLHYNLETGELSMDDFMAYDDDEKRFFMGKNNNRREILKGVKLPTYAELEASAKNIDFKDKMKSIKDLEDYKENTKSTLDDKISSNFENEEVNKFYIERFNEKNIAEQTVLKNIFDNWSKNSGGGSIVDFENSTEVGPDKPNQHQMMKLIYNTLEHFRSPEDLRRFQTSINKLNVLIDKNRQDTLGTIKDPVFSGLFNEKSMIDSKRERKNDGLSEKKIDFNYEINYLTFFDMMGQSKKNTKGEPIIDINIFEKVTQVLENNQEEIKDNTVFLGGNENIAFMDRYTEKYGEYIDNKLGSMVNGLDSVSR